MYDVSLEEELERLKNIYIDNKQEAQPKGCLHPNWYIEVKSGQYCPDCCRYIDFDFNTTSKKYRPIYNLNKIINIYTGKSLISYDKRAFTLLQPLFQNQEYNINLLKIAKKRLKLYKVYKDCKTIIVIFCVVNNQVLKITDEERLNINRIFNKILSWWAVHKSEYQRINLIKYEFLLSMILKHLGIKGYNNLIPLKRRRKLYYKIWERITQDIRFK